MDPAVARAAALFSSQHFKEAEAALEPVLKATPDDVDANYYDAACALALDDPARAVARLEHAAALAPKEGRIQNLLGDAYGLSALKSGVFGKMGLARKCAAAYQRAVELEPSSVAFRLSYLGFCREAPGFVGGGSERAYAQAAELRKLDPVMGAVSFSQLKGDEKRFDEAFAAIDGVPGGESSYALLYQRGRLAALSGQRLDEGVKALRRCLEQAAPDGLPGRGPVEWRLGNIYEAKGDPTSARAAYQKALEAEPNFQPAADALKKLPPPAGAS